MRILALFIVLTLSLRAECTAVTGDRILVGDVAVSIPAFQAANPTLEIGFAPIPGMTRTLKATEIATLARRLNVSLPAESARDLCFESPAAMLAEDEIRAAIETAAGQPVVSIRIVDFGRSPLPPGRLEFPPAGLVHAADCEPPKPVLWRGRLITERGRSFPVWAKVEMVVRFSAVVAAREITKDRLLAPEDLVRRDEVRFPLPEGGVYSSIDELIGKSVRCRVAAGQVIPAPLVDKPKEVVQGRTVHVDAISGDARVSFDGVAQTSGRRGDLVMVRNPNGRTFKAQVVEKGRVEVR